MLSHRRVVVFDLETTGLSPFSGDRIIEVGAVEIIGSKITNKFQSLVKQQVIIPPFVSKINGITAAMLKDQPGPEEILPEFYRFIENAVLVAYNAKFDLNFLRAEMAQLGLKILNRSQCTLQMSRKRYPDLPNYRLETVAQHVLGTLPENLKLHRALDDARLAAMVWLQMIKGA